MCFFGCILPDVQSTELGPAAGALCLWWCGFPTSLSSASSPATRTLKARCVHVRGRWLWRHSQPDDDDGSDGYGTLLEVPRWRLSEFVAAVTLLLRHAEARSGPAASTVAALHRALLDEWQVGMSWREQGRVPCRWCTWALSWTWTRLSAAVYTCGCAHLCVCLTGALDGACTYTMKRACLSVLACRTSLCSCRAWRWTGQVPLLAGWVAAQGSVVDCRCQQSAGSWQRHAVWSQWQWCAHGGGKATREQLV